MRTIRVSEEVWQAIATQGKFGETEEDVLRRVFKLPENSAHDGVQPTTGLGKQRSHSASSSPRRVIAERRMRSFLRANQLHVSFYDGPSQSWMLPQRSDKLGIRSVREKAVAVARGNGATEGQVNAVRKALTDGGYHLHK